ncbi:MAG: GNAT family N-acetyltransferase [Candidatus Sifarchaeia archaeon]
MSSHSARVARIREIEEAAFRAWPASEVAELGGWLLRADVGVTRRANSVLALGTPSLNLGEAIEFVIDFYRARRLIPRFQLSDVSCPSGLDDALADANFQYEMRTLVQTLSLKRLTRAHSKHEVTLNPAATEEWLSALARFGFIDDHSLKARKEILGRIPGRTRFASVRVNGTIVGVCVGVVDNGWLGIFGLVTDREHRRKGIANSLNRRLVSWAIESGATRAYLQVESQNEPALTLYNRLGFRTEYEYHYRLLSE